MPSYQAAVTNAGADGKTEFFASLEFEAVNTAAAMAAGCSPDPTIFATSAISATSTALL
jgi:hypothetical protein